MPEKNIKELLNSNAAFAIKQERTAWNTVFNGAFQFQVKKQPVAIF